MAATFTNKTFVTAVEKIPAATEDLIHDCQLDYYGKCVATGGSDRRIKLYDVDANGQRVQTAELTGHEGPVWNVAWAHPEFGRLLGSCSYDRQVFVWKELAPQHWGLVHKFLGHEGSVNAIAWGPREYGLRLACASSDENVSVLTHHGEGQWSSVMLQGKEGRRAHKMGANAVSWAPAAAGLRLVTGGCDNRIVIWACGEDGLSWSEEAELGVHNGKSVHTDWVRDVAWAPSPGGAPSIIASCAQDKKIVIWSEGNGQWTPKEIVMSTPIFSVSWSLTGGVLAAAGGDNQVTLWKANALGEWEQIGQLSEDAQPQELPTRDGHLTWQPE